jgi:hypothetical protein
MRTRSIVRALTLSLLVGIAVGARAQAVKPDFVEKYESNGVPTQTRKSEFDPASGIPIPNKSKTTKPSESALSVKAQPPTEQERQAFASAFQALAKSPELSAKLGNESRLLSGGELPKPRSGDTQPQYKFTYYNYKKDQAVEAYVSSGKVTRVRERELGYQPTVSQEELAEAVKIMKEKGAPISGVAPESLRGLAQSGPNGRREIRVFAAGDRANSAVVDLYTRKVFEK